IRAERAEVEACTVDGVRYATREMADAVRADMADRAARTVGGMVYATVDQAEAVRNSTEARTVDGHLYLTFEMAEKARAEKMERESRIVNGVEYATREEADRVRQNQKQSKVFALIFDEYANKMVFERPQSKFAAEKKEEVRKTLSFVLAGADADTLNVWKTEIQNKVKGNLAAKNAPVPLANTAIEEIERLLSEPGAKTQTVQGVSQPPTAQAQSVPLQQKKDNSGLVMFFVVAVLAGAACLYWAQQNKKGPFAPRVQYQNTPAVRRQTPPSSSVPRAPQTPSIDRSSPYAQGYNYTSSGNELYSEPGKNHIGRSLNPNARVNILAKAKDTNGTWYYKIQFYHDGSTRTAWTRADWMTVLPTGRSIPDETPAPAVSNPPVQLPAPDVPKLTGDRPLTRNDARKGYVTALGLNVRADHDNTSRIIAQAEQGASLSIVDEWRDYDSEYPWYKIDDLSEWGWVYGKYVTVNDGARIGLVTLKTGKMNIHTDHAKISPNIGTVEAGGRYQVAEIWTSKEVPYPWYCIIVDESIGSTGWVSGRYFKIDGLPSNEGYKLSDEEYNEFRQHVDFAAADDAMSIVWATIKDRASSTRYAELLKGQKAWLAQRRDRMATSIFNKAGRVGLPKRECYVRATQARIKELQAALNKL
ncbi:MAG: SH3 domain-containing protein, partial [Pyramidobacter sp.]|nr:SH3 domain-containing protein [Pyramidobacter sp.]